MTECCEGKKSPALAGLFFSGKKVSGQEYMGPERRSFFSRIFRILSGPKGDLTEISSGLALVIFGVFAPIHQDKMVALGIYPAYFPFFIPAIFMLPLMIVMGVTQMYAMLINHYSLRRLCSFAALLFWAYTSICFAFLQWWGIAGIYFAMSVSMGLAYIKMGCPIDERKG